MSKKKKYKPKPLKGLPGNKITIMRSERPHEPRPVTAEGQRPLRTSFRMDMRQVLAVAGLRAEREAETSPMIEGVRAGDAAAVRDAIASGADVNAVDRRGMTALHHAAALDARPCIRVLVNSGRCDYLRRDELGRYASELAIEWGRDPAVARLLSKHQARQAHERGEPAFVKPQNK